MIDKTAIINKYKHLQNPKAQMRLKNGTDIIACEVDSNNQTHYVIKTATGFDVIPAENNMPTQIFTQEREISVEVKQTP